MLVPNEIITITQAANTIFMVSDFSACSDDSELQVKFNLQVKLRTDGIVMITDSIIFIFKLSYSLFVDQKKGHLFGCPFFQL